MAGSAGSAWAVEPTEVDDDGLELGILMADLKDDDDLDDLDDDDLDDDDLDDEDDDDLDDDEDDDLIDLDDEYDDADEEVERPQHPGRFDD